MLVAAIILLALAGLAAAAGLLMAFRDFSAQRVLPVLAVLHGVIAVTAPVLLILAAW